MELKNIQRFVIKIRKTENCWEWIACKDKNGYGHFNLNGINRFAHSVSYELFKNEIQKGLEIDHLCRNTSCVNPEHLEAVTPKTNCLRGRGFGGVNSRKKLCKYGHIYDKKNNRGDRVCMICKRIAGAKNRIRCKILGIDRNLYKKKGKRN